MHFEGRVRVDGQFKGEIKSDDTLVIGDGAEVNAEIECATVIVRGGVVHGNIRAKTSIEIHAPGKVVGNIHSPSVFIDRGVEFSGKLPHERRHAREQDATEAERKDHGRVVIRFASALLALVAFGGCGNAATPRHVEHEHARAMDALGKIDAGAEAEAGPNKLELMAARHDRVAPGTREIARREIDLAVKGSETLALPAFESDTCVRALFDLGRADRRDARRTRAR